MKLKLKETIEKITNGGTEITQGHRLTMETLWLQRSSSDVPWGFRLQGGREYGTILQVQRVTPGSVASSGLGPGDTIMKIGNVNATNLSHNEGQEIIRNAGNILQLTIKKLSASCQAPAPLSPNQYSYDSQVSAQLYQASPRPQPQQHQHNQQVSYGYNLSQDTSNQPYRIQIQHSKTPSYPETNSYQSRAFIDTSQQQAPSYSSPNYLENDHGYDRQHSQHVRTQSDNYQTQLYTPQYNTQSSPDPSYGVQNMQQHQSPRVQTSHQYQQQQQQAFSPTSYNSQQFSKFSDGYYGANETQYVSTQPKSPSTHHSLTSPFSPGGTSYYEEEVKSPSYKSPIMPGGGTLDRSFSNEQQSSPYSPPQSSTIYNTLSPTGTYSRNASSDYNQTDYSQTFPRSYNKQMSQPQPTSSSYVSDHVPYGSPSKNILSSTPSTNQTSLINRSTSQPGHHYDDTPEQPAFSATSHATFSSTKQPTSPLNPTNVDSQYGAPPLAYRSEPTPPQRATAVPQYSPQIPAPPPMGDLNSLSNSPYSSTLPNYGVKRSPGTTKQDGSKVPDGLISAMNKPGKKPFSYGIDLEELKQRTSRQAAPAATQKVKKAPVGPPSTAPKPSVAKTNVMPGGPPGSGSTYKNTSDTLRMVQERDASKYQPQSEIDESHIHVNPTGSKGKQSLSFKVLQWMTETDNPNVVNQDEFQSDKPKKGRNPLLRHNSEDDEMRFSGLHSKADIPSKAFGRVQHMKTSDSPTQNDNGQERVGNYDETSIRYKGKFIPSPSFRVLQNWAALDTDIESPAQRRANKDEDEDDGLPDTLSNEELVDVRYKGGNIPSKVFKSLQKAVGDDTPEIPAAPQNGIKVISKAVPQTVQQGGNAGTDF